MLEEGREEGRLHMGLRILKTRPTVVYNITPTHHYTVTDYSYSSALEMYFFICKIGA
jgi:hypothetical protein